MPSDVYKTVNLKPRLSEKAYEHSQALNRYTFVVPKNTNKLTVAEAVKVQFGVDVLNVNITVIKGKKKRTVRKGGRPVAGRQSDFKKAYVTIGADQSIPIFQNEDEEKSKSSKNEKKGK